MKGSSLIFLVILVVVFYVLILLPQRRQQKKRSEMMKKIGPGAKVMTAGGMYAEIVSMTDNLVVAKVAEGVNLQLDPRSVVRVVEEGPTDPFVNDAGSEPHNVLDTTNEVHHNEHDRKSEF